MSNMEKDWFLKVAYLFPYRSFSWDRNLESKDCISHSLMWPWNTMRNVTVCVKETQEGNCILHSSPHPHWHPEPPTRLPHPHQHLPQDCQMLPLAVVKILLIVSIQKSQLFASTVFHLQDLKVFWKKRHREESGVPQQCFLEEGQRMEEIFNHRNKSSVCGSLASSRLTALLFHWQHCYNLVVVIWASDMNTRKWWKLTADCEQCRKTWISSSCLHIQIRMVYVLQTQLLDSSYVAIN